MAAKIAYALPTLFLLSPSPSDLNPRHPRNLIPSSPQRRPKFFGLPDPRPLRVTAVRKSEEEYITGEEECSSSLPQEFYDDEWQARQRAKTKEWHAYRQKEEEEEERRTNEYREIGTRLKGYPEEEVRKAKILVSSFIRSGEEIEEESMRGLGWWPVSKYCGSELNNNTCRLQQSPRGRNNCPEDIRHAMPLQTKSLNSRRGRSDCHEAIQHAMPLHTNSIEKAASENKPSREGIF